MIVVGEDDKGRSNAVIVEEFYLCALCRPPTDDELTRWQQRLETNDPNERKRRLEDFVWSLLNSRSFMENH